MKKFTATTRTWLRHGGTEEQLLNTVRAQKSEMGKQEDRRIAAATGGTPEQQVMRLLYRQTPGTTPKESTLRKVHLLERRLTTASLGGRRTYTQEKVWKDAARAFLSDHAALIKALGIR